MIFKKMGKGTLAPEIAADMLQNIFESCDTEPTSVPVEVLISYTKYRHERYTFQKVIIGIVLFLFCLAPIIAIRPNFSISNCTKEDSKPLYKISIHNILPISSVTATIDDQRIPVYLTKSNVYSMSPSFNGKLKVKVKLINGQYLTKTYFVGEIDKDVPVLLTSKKGTDTVIFKVEDTGSGLNLKDSYAQDSNGNKINCVTYNEEDGTIVFPYPPADINIFIYDNAGNLLQLVMTVK